MEPFNWDYIGDDQYGPIPAANYSDYNMDSDEYMQGLSDFNDIWSTIKNDKEIYCHINFTALHQYPPTGKSFYPYISSTHKLISDST